MATFWDSSAVVALVFEEPTSPTALQAWNQGGHRLAWHWMRVETHTALVRRSADPMQIRQWREIMNQFDWIDLPCRCFDDLNTINRAWGLRSADAGHLFLFRELHKRNRELALVSFDREMCDAARAKGWPLWRG